MTTLQRIRKYNRLLVKDPDLADDWVRRNKHDRRFFAIVTLHRTVVPTVKSAGLAIKRYS